MNLYLLTQTENDDYDTYDSCIVAADSEDKARLITPASYGNGGFDGCMWASSTELVTVELIGKAIKGTVAGVIIGSFNAG